MILGSFIFFLSAFFLIGVSSAWKSRGTASDYYLASRQVRPMFVGLSAMSTNNSGYMFVGFMGYTYLVGLDAMWLLIGWIAGDMTTSFFIHRKLREISASTQSMTFAEVIERWSQQGSGQQFYLIRLMVSVISLIFLSIYAAGQFSAGGKSLEALFGLETIYGALLVAVMVAAYCFSGGLRASLWTDVAQTLVMLGSMGGLAFVALYHFGGISGSYQTLAAIPDRLNPFPSGDLLFSGTFAALPVFIISWLVSGFCAAGQPHIMVRFMTMEQSGHITAVRAWYYGAYTLFGTFCLIVGLLTKAYFPDIGGMDAELILPQMADALLPDIMVGLILAGIFAALMSTADSLLISSSASFTHDILPEKFETPFEMKLATLGITCFSFLVAFYAIEFGGQNVLRLTQFAWSGMGAAFGPLLLLLALRQPLTPYVSMAMMATAFIVVVSWTELGLPLGTEQGELGFYEGLAGVLASFAVWGLWRIFPSQKVVAET